LVYTYGEGTMLDPDKRQFFKKLFTESILKPIAAFKSGVEEVDSKIKLDEFFGSYESSYTLTLNYPDEIIVETARMEGIEVEGREKIDIVRDLIKKKGEYSNRF
jgi:hypothetical protein